MEMHKAPFYVFTDPLHILNAPNHMNTLLCNSTKTHTHAHLMAMHKAPFNVPTDPLHRPTRPPVSSPSVAANLNSLGAAS